MKIAGIVIIVIVVVIVLGFGGLYALGVISEKQHWFGH